MAIAMGMGMQKVSPASDGWFQSAVEVFVPTDCPLSLAASA